MAAGGRAEVTMAIRKKFGRRVRTKTRKSGAVEFNHAMIYTTRLSRALEFYRDALGFQVGADYPGAYARRKRPCARRRVALHVLQAVEELAPRYEALRLHSELDTREESRRPLSQ